jgi:PKD repeat protein
MRKPLLLAAVVIGLMANLQATITTIPPNGIVNVGDNIGFHTNCTYYYSQDYWYWGDGQTYTCISDYPLHNTIFHIYKNPGNYIVHVHRTLFNCLLDEYKNVTVLENRSLTMSPVQPGVGQPITFTAVNFQTPTDITWDMGDGTIYAHRASPIVHTYAKSGTFTVRAYDWRGNMKTTPVTLTLSLTRIITFSPAMPRVDEPVDIHAIGFRSDAIDWNFGDGTPPLTGATAVSHRYQNPGSFTITAREHGSSDLPVVSQAIAILPENRSVELSTPEARTDEPVTMTAVNFRGPLVLWDFGDRSGAAGAVERITDMEGNGIVIGGDFTLARADHLLIHGTLTYPGDAEYLILQVYANDTKVDQLLFRDVKKDEKRSFETSVSGSQAENRIVLQVLKSSSPSRLVGGLEAVLKKGRSSA